MPLLQPLQTAVHWLRQRLKPYRHPPSDLSSPAEDPAEELSVVQRASYFHALAKQVPAPDLVDDRTWNDLEMERVFHRLNRSTTALGAQYLYASLRRYQPCPERLHQNLSATKAIDSDSSRALRQALRPLQSEAAAEVADLLLGPPLAVPARHQVFYAVALGALICPFGLLLSAWFLPVCLALWLGNIVLHCVYHRQIVRHATALAGLGTLLACVPRVVRALQQSGWPEAHELGALAEAARNIRQQIARLFLKRGALNDLTLVVLEYLNVLCLFELCFLCRAALAVNREREALLRIHQIVARLDALQGLVTALAAFPVVCAAEVCSGPGFQLVDAYHPLLDRPVPNSIQALDHSLLFTGTNMAGKTTFIKTLAINLLLAQTLGLCLARKAVLPRARLKTLINRPDTVLEGQSYFYFEATELLRMLNEAKSSSRQVWFVLDEVFRGTNSVERVAAAAAVLEHLARAGRVIASTHDQELSTLLAPHFEPYHFSEVVDGQDVRFDFRLRHGPCKVRNAIKLLGLAGYPAEVVQVAERVAASVGSMTPPGEARATTPRAG